jgi:long-chain acyl-CoA synthetase
MAVLTSDQAGERGDDVALIDETGETTWARLDARVNRLVNGLRARGLKAGDTVVVISGNRREWFEIALACAHGGWTYVPANWHFAPDELAYLIEDAGTRAVLADHRFAAAAAEALADARAKDIVAVVGVSGPEGGDLSALARDPRFVEYEAVLAAASPDEPADQALGGPMFYTSGTTGRPKGVRGALMGVPNIPPAMMKQVAAGIATMIPPTGRALLCGPFYHSAQWAFTFLPLLAGASVVMRHRFDAAETLKVIDAHDVTHIHLVPTQLKRLLDLPDEAKAGFSGASLQGIWHGAAPCPPAVKRGMIEWWGPIITEYYGSTEGSIISTVTAEEWLAKGGSVGKPSPQVEVIVVDDEGRRVGQGEEGVLYFRNLSGADFRYHNDEAKTAAAHLEPGVFTTGDVGRIDEDGYLWLTDRKIDMIISGGVNIYPAEIEGVLNAHPAVADAAVIGVPDEEFGENVKGIVALKEGHAPSAELEEDLRAHCHARLARYKTPKSFDFVETIPRSAAGKILKAPLRAPYWAGRDRRI